MECEEVEVVGEEEINVMVDLEVKNVDVRREMVVVDVLDEICYWNVRINRNEKDGMDYVDMVVRLEDEEWER